jgi:nitronate monooxygenase
MPLPSSLESRLRIPAMAAPLFLASGVDLVTEVCRSGLVGTFPALNARSTRELVRWTEEIAERLERTPDSAPYGINLIIHKSNPRLHADLEIVVRRKVPLVITSLGAVKDVVEAVHGYGGLVFHDVISRRHAEKAAEAGVDGIIAVCAGAGGHGGTLSPFALVPEIRQIFDGTIVLAGAISTGAHIAAARVLGADLSYLGTRFLTTREAMVSEAQKRMVLDCTASDVIYTSEISGISANFLRPSIEAAGIRPDDPRHVPGLDFETEAKAWKHIWSAGQGVGSIDAVLPAAELCQRLISEYHAALRSLTV